MTYLKIEEYDNKTSLKNYNFKNPLVLRGFCKNTNAYRNWNTKTMPQIFGTNKVEVECYLNKEDYFKKATFMKKGEIDPSNNWKVSTDCYNLPINKLNNIKLIKNETH